MRDDKASCNQVPQKGTPGPACSSRWRGSSLCRGLQHRAQRGSTGLQEAVGNPGQGRTLGLDVLLPCSLVPALEMGERGARFLLKNVQKTTLMAHLLLWTGGWGGTKLKIYNILSLVQVKDLHAVLQSKSTKTHS